MKAFILLSGGIDSMACVNFYKALNYEVECIFCDYGQPASISEKQASQIIAAYYSVPYETIEVKNINIPKLGEICGRNALLIWAAFCKIGFGSYKIVLGIHAGTEYPDCSPQFIDATNRLCDEYKRLASIEDAIEIIISVALCGITFLDYQEYFNITIQRPTFIVGCISIFLLAFTLIKQGVGHKELCEKHQIAGKMYSQAKLDIASKIAEWNISDTSTKDILNYIDSHFSSLNKLPQIPEKHFNRLKHMHQSKVEMSKFLDSHKKDFWVICRLKFRFSRNADEKRDKSDDDSDVR